jgi:hypothetical protein
MPLIQTAIVVAAFLAVASIVWFTLHTGISPMPSSAKARAAMLDAIADAPTGAIVDLGSGWGGLAIAAARRYPHRRVVGYEVSWLPWAVSRLRASCLRLHNLTLLRRDFLRADLGASAVLLCYLFRRGMRQLEHKLVLDDAWPHVLVSNTFFVLPSTTPHEVRVLDDLMRTRVHVYRLSRRRHRVARSRAAGAGCRVPSPPRANHVHRRRG